MRLQRASDWPLSERERLGAELLAAGRADEAERVFRADLERDVDNPRSLFGVWKSLESRKRAAEARARFEAAWAGADVTLGPDLLGAARQVAPALRAPRSSVVGCGHMPTRTVHYCMCR